MVQGMSYLQLYYDKACTRELEKDFDGNYIYNFNNISTSVTMPLLMTLWCKNNGSHTAYETSVKLISSDVEINFSEVIDKILSLQIVSLPISINIKKGDMAQHSIVLKFDYDSI